VIWMDRIKAGRFAGTKLLIPPASFAERVSADGTPCCQASRISGQLRPVFDLCRPAALSIERYRPFHAGHRRLFEDGIKRVGQPALRSATLKELLTPIRCRSLRQNSEFTAIMRSFWGEYSIIPAPI
jgi:adenylylsulfate kinase